MKIPTSDESGLCLTVTLTLTFLFGNAEWIVCDWKLNKEQKDYSDPHLAFVSSFLTTKKSEQQAPQLVALWQWAIIACFGASSVALSVWNRSLLSRVPSCSLWPIAGKVVVYSPELAFTLGSCKALFCCLWRWNTSNTSRLHNKPPPSSRSNTAATAALNAMEYSPACMSSSDVCPIVVYGSVDVKSPLAESFIMLSMDQQLSVFAVCCRACNKIANVNPLEIFKEKHHFLSKKGHAREGEKV